MKYRPKMQMAGSMPKQQDYPDYESWIAAVDNWTMSMARPTPNIPVVTNPQPIEAIGQSQNQLTPNAPSVLALSNAPTPPNPNRTNILDTLEKGKRLGEETTSGSAVVKPREKKDPYDTLMKIGLGLRTGTVGLGLLSGAVARNQQNKYDYTQQTALGQINPMQASDFQPTPYNLYAEHGGAMNPFSYYSRYGGNLKKLMKEFTNKAQMDMGDGKLDDQGMMKKGGYEIDRMLVVRKILPELLQLGRLGTSKYRRMKKGGIYIKPENRGKFTKSAKAAGMGVQEFARHVLANKEDYSSTQVKRANFARNASKWNKKGGLTPNKAREILHDGTAHGKPLTDKQRRYFGAMSKGHTNYRGK